MSNEATQAEAPDVIRINRVSKRFVLRKDNSLKERLIGFGRVGRRHKEDFWVLHDIDLTIRAGETVGLIGHNGSGKSTLLKLIGGILDPTDGSVEHRGRLAALLELGAGFHPDLTGRENVYLNASLLGLSRDETDQRFDAITEFAGIGEFIDTQVKFYSSGMFVRLAFAVAINTDPDILLVDEVLSVGDEAFQRKCLEKISEFRTQGVAIVFVSHGLDSVQELCDRVVLLDHGRILHDGDTREGIRQFRTLLNDQLVRPRGKYIQKVTASSGDDRFDALLRPGDDLVIRVEIDRATEIGPWFCSVQVDDVKGRIAFGVSTWEITGQEWIESSDDRVAVTFRIPAPALADGRYYVNSTVMVRDPHWHHLDDSLQAASFEVESDEPTYGIVRVGATAEIDPIG